VATKKSGFERTTFHRRWEIRNGGREGEVVIVIQADRHFASNQVLESVGGVFYGARGFCRDEIRNVVTPFPKAKPICAPLDVGNAGLSLREAPVDVRISDINPAEPESLRLEVHPWREREAMGDHVTGHDEKQDEHDDDRTGLGGSKQ